jgi:hypothetical protein
MKKIFYVIGGLMSLLGLFSCDDYSTFYETEEFAPYFYTVKSATTIQIMGPKGLVVAEKAKNDWEVIVQGERVFFGSESLQLEGEGRIPLTAEMMEKNSCELDILTNTENRLTDEYNIDGQSNVLTVVLKGFLEPYTYLGKEISLNCADPLMLTTKVNVKRQLKDPFYEEGTIHYSLETLNSTVLAENDVNYTVSTEEGYEKYIEDEIKDENKENNEQTN